MAKGKNKTGRRNPDGSTAQKTSQGASDDRRTDQGNTDKQSSSVSAENGIKQLIDAGCEIVETPNATYKKGKISKAQSWVKDRFGVECPKLSNTAESVCMRFEGDEFTISIKGMLAFRTLKNIEDITGIHLVSG